MLGSLSSTGFLIAEVKQGLRQLGWQEGNQIEFVFASPDGRPERMDAAARELVEKRVDVIVVASTPLVRAAQKATQSIPIVMAYTANPVESGLVASLARPDRNTTGIANQADAVFGKAIEALNAVAPRAKRVAILVNESSVLHAPLWDVARKACAALSLTSIRVTANAPDGLEPAFAQIARDRAQAVAVAIDGMFLQERATIAKLTQREKLPSAYGVREHVVAGGLLSYAANIAQSFRAASVYVDKILKGVKPSDLPVQQAAKFELVINLKTAKALGLRIPQAVLVRADEVIQ